MYANDNLQEIARKESPISILQALAIYLHYRTLLKYSLNIFLF